jgi:peroxiredoxin
MSLRINDTAPNFSADTTQGRIDFHQWIGDSWAILFSHPKDFTPVCTTELGYMAGIEDQFRQRNCKLIGLSIDPVTNHEKWSDDIEATQGHRPKYPMIGDTDLAVAKLYNMLPAEEPGTSEGRTDHRRLGQRRRREEALPTRLEGATAVPANRSSTEGLRNDSSVRLRPSVPLPRAPSGRGLQLVPPRAGLRPAARHARPAAIGGRR